MSLEEEEEEEAKERNRVKKKSSQVAQPLTDIGISQRFAPLLFFLLELA